jgi:hypothetical protein
MTDTATRPDDIVSPIADGALPNRVTAAEARTAGRYGHDKPTPDNSILLLIDHQIGLLAGMRDTTSLAELKSNLVGLARTVKALQLPVQISSSNAQWQNGDNLPEIMEIFADQPIYRRTGIINCYEDPTFRKALEDMVEATGRRHIIIAGVTMGEPIGHRGQGLAHLVEVFEALEQAKVSEGCCSTLRF